MKHPQRLLLVSLLLPAVALTACGGSSNGSAAQKPAPGTPGNPMVAKVTEPSINPDGTQAAAPGKTTKGGGKSAGTSQAPARLNEAQAPASGQSAKIGEPAYQSLVDKQTKHPQTRFSPCNLVTADQAQAVLGARMQMPIEAPQGPTCIYRTQTGKSLVGVSVQTIDFNQVKPLMRQRHSISVASHSGVCGTYGQSMLYVPLSRGRVLSISAPCDIAKGFAVRALPHL